MSLFRRRPRSNRHRRDRLFDARLDHPQEMIPRNYGDEPMNPSLFTGSRLIRGYRVPVGSVMRFDTYSGDGEIYDPRDTIPLNQATLRRQIGVSGVGRLDMQWNRESARGRHPINDLYQDYFSEHNPHPQVTMRSFLQSESGEDPSDLQVQNALNAVPRNATLLSYPMPEGEEHQVLRNAYNIDFNETARVRDELEARRRARTRIRNTNTTESADRSDPQPSAHSFDHRAFRTGLGLNPDNIRPRNTRNIPVDSFYMTGPRRTF